MAVIIRLLWKKSRQQNKLSLICPFLLVLKQKISDKLNECLNNVAQVSHEMMYMLKMKFKHARKYINGGVWRVKSPSTWRKTLFCSLLCEKASSRSQHFPHVQTKSCHILCESFKTQFQADLFNVFRNKVNTGQNKKAFLKLIWNHLKDSKQKSAKKEQRKQKNEGIWVTWWWHEDKN